MVEGQFLHNSLLFNLSIPSCNHVYNIISFVVVPSLNSTLDCFKITRAQEKTDLIQESLSKITYSDCNLCGVSMMATTTTDFLLVGLLFQHSRVNSMKNDRVQRDSHR